MSRLDDLRGIASGLWWLVGGAHGGLRELPDRLGYLAEGEAAHLALIEQLRTALRNLATATEIQGVLGQLNRSLTERLGAAQTELAAANEARKKLGAETLRLRTERDELQRRVDGQDALLLAQLDVQRQRAEAAEAKVKAIQEAAGRSQALRELPVGVAVDVGTPVDLRRKRT